jgi:hypothetical protein
MRNGQVVLSHGDDEFDLCTGALAKQCCPAEGVVTGTSSCKERYSKPVI